MFKRLVLRKIVGFGLAQGLYFKSINISSLKEFAGFSFVEVLVQSDLSLYSISKGFILEKNNELIFLPLPSLINDIDVTKNIDLGLSLNCLILEF